MKRWRLHLAIACLVALVSCIAWAAPSGPSHHSSQRPAVHAAETRVPDPLAGLYRAKPGDTIKLPAQTIRISKTVLPPGVSLRGAGYDKTILQIVDGDAGLIVQGDQPTAISGLTITGAVGAALNVEAASNLTVERVRLTGNGVGLRAHLASNLVVQNVIIDHNQYGLWLSQCTGVNVIFTTFAQQTDAAIVLSGCADSALFNNLVSGVGGRGPGRGRERRRAWTGEPAADDRSQSLRCAGAGGDRGKC